MSDIHLGRAFLRQGHGEMVVRFATLCGQTLRDPVHVTSDTNKATCPTCCEEIRATITDETLKALILGRIPSQPAGAAFGVEDEWALCRKGWRDASCVLGVWH